jgi:hypothetical protein
MCPLGRGNTLFSHFFHSNFFLLPLNAWPDEKADKKWKVREFITVFSWGTGGVSKPWYRGSLPSVGDRQKIEKRLLGLEPVQEQRCKGIGQSVIRREDGDQRAGAGGRCQGDRCHGEKVRWQRQGGPRPREGRGRGERGFRDKGQVGRGQVDIVQMQSPGQRPWEQSTSVAEDSGQSQRQRPCEQRPGRHRPVGRARGRGQVGRGQVDIVQLAEPKAEARWSEDRGQRPGGPRGQRPPVMEILENNGTQVVSYKHSLSI